MVDGGHGALSEDDTTRLAETFHLLGDRNRLRIALACLEAPVAVGELADGLGLSQSLVSHHLRLLRATRLLKAERRGRHVYYSALDAHVRDMLREMTAHVGEPEPAEGA